MGHPVSRAHIPATIQARIDRLPKEDFFGSNIIRGFGVFIDTHRDQPHIPVFHEDIHRGQCAPMMVDYLTGDDMLRNPENGELIQRHDKHLFIEPEAWASFMLEWLMEGTDPRDGSGCLPTSHFRDARKKVYLLRSFRQMVLYNEMKAAKEAKEKE
jgi:hypothetical protein